MAKKKAEQVADPVETLVTYKGFDANFKCRDYQYEVGMSYTHEGEVLACKSGFHSCENPLDVFSYYAPGQGRFAIVEASGEISRKENESDSKIASANLHIKAELSIPEIIVKAIEWVTTHCTPADSNHATGYRSASSATGDQSASSATGIAAVALNIGRFGKARASEHGAIVLCWYGDDESLIHIKASKVGENGIQPDVFYALNEAGEFVKAEQ